MSWSKRDWFFFAILAVVTMLAYQARMARGTFVE
jgi:hypothetical protein